MPRWSKHETINLDEVSIKIDKAFDDLQEFIKPALKSAVDQGESIIKDRTPVLTGRLKKSWRTVENPDGYTTGNDAADPKTGYNYATTVELGLKRRAGPAYMIRGAVVQIVDIIRKEVGKIT